MKDTIVTDETLLVEKVVKILFEEIGPVETGHFFSIPVKQRLESLQRHKQWQANLNKEDFFNKVFK